MKRLSLFIFAGLLFALSMSFISLTHASAPAVLTDTQGHALSIQSQCNYNNSLVLLSDNHSYFVYTPSTEKIESLSSESVPLGIDWLVTDQERLYGYDPAGLVYPLTLNDGHLFAHDAITLQQNSSTEPEDAMSLPENLVIIKDALYALYRPQSMDGYRTILIAWALEDGNLLDLQAPTNLQGIAKYLDDELLGICFDALKTNYTFEQDNEKPVLWTFDPLDGKSTALGPLEHIIAQHQIALASLGNGDILYVSDSKLYRHDLHGKETLCAYLPFTYFTEGCGDRLVPLANQRCAMLSAKQALICSTTALTANIRTMTIWGRPLDSAAGNTAEQSVQDLQLRYLEPAWEDAVGLGKLLAGGASNIDLMFLFSDRDEVERLVDKGYCLDLSSSSIIKQHLDRCYPLVREQAMRGEAIYLIPVDLDALVYRADPVLFDMVGLNIPQTFEELCTFLNTWMRDKAELFHDIRPISYLSVMAGLRYEALKIRFSLLRYQGKVVSFDTPMLREMLKYTETSEIASMNFPASDQFWEEKGVLLQRTNYDLINFTSGSDGLPEEAARSIIIRANSETPPVFPVRLGYLAITAQSKNFFADLQFVENYLCALNQQTRVKLYPDENTPIEMEGIDAFILSFQEYVDEKQLLLSNAEGAERNQLSSELTEAKESLEYAINNRYLLSADVIKQHREKMQFAIVDDKMINFSEYHPEVRTLIERYMHGQLSMEHFLQEADAKLRIMQLEME